MILFTFCDYLFNDFLTIRNIFNDNNSILHWTLVQDVDFTALIETIPTTAVCSMLLV